MLIIKLCKCLHAVELRPFKNCLNFGLHEEHLQNALVRCGDFMIFSVYIPIQVSVCQLDWGSRDVQTASRCRAFGEKSLLLILSIIFAACTLVASPRQYNTFKLQCQIFELQSSGPCSDQELRRLWRLSRMGSFQNLISSVLSTHPKSLFGLHRGELAAH